MDTKTVHKAYGPYEKYFKRPLDLFCGLLAVIVFWWLYVIVTILVRVKLGSPVLFTQDRPGLNEKIFRLYKFRSMTDERDENGELMPDEVRLTKFGKLLRSTSLDGKVIIRQTRKNFDFAKVSPVSSTIFFPCKGSYTQMSLCNASPNRIAKAA